MEATGPYSEALALWLYAQGHRVSLLNPGRVKQYAASAGRRNKTDLLDAAIIADFVCAMKPAPWQPPTLEVAQLQALVRRREELCVMLQGEKNPLEGVAVGVRPSLQRIIVTLSAEKRRVEKLILQQIRSHHQLCRDHQLLCTIKGIGSLTASILLAEMARPGQVERARQAAAHAGLVPRREESGSSVRRNRGLGREGQPLPTQGPLHARSGSHQIQRPLKSLRFTLAQRWQTQDEHRLRSHAQAYPYCLRRAQAPKAL